VILSDRDLKVELEQGGLVIQPLSPGAIQPASVDLHLGNKIIFEGEWTIGNHVLYAVQPGQFLLACLQEHIEIPDYLVGRLEGKSSWARKGLLVHTTAGYVDPGWKGILTLELHNVSSKAVEIWVGCPIAQISIMNLSSPAERPYGSKELNSRYQGATGPERSKL
jgi:dCTP deaminase